MAVAESGSVYNGRPQSGLYLALPCEVSVESCLTCSLVAVVFVITIRPTFRQRMHEYLNPSEDNTLCGLLLLHQLELCVTGSCL